MIPRRTARLLLWAVAVGATAAATAAAVVAVRAGLGQEQARVAEVFVIAACAGIGALILTSRPGQPVGRALLVGGALWGLASLPVELLVGAVHAQPDDRSRRRCSRSPSPCAGSAGWSWPSSCRWCSPTARHRGAGGGCGWPRSTSSSSSRC